MSVVIRAMRDEDLPVLMEISPPVVKPPIEFAVFPTLVAVVDGAVAGYTQFSLTPDRVFHSLAIRVRADVKGRGVGQRLADARVELGRAAGATMHIAAVDADGEAAMKKILLKQGLHLCQRREKDNVEIYVGTFADD